MAADHARLCWRLRTAGRRPNHYVHFMQAMAVARHSVDRWVLRLPPPPHRPFRTWSPPEASPCCHSPATRSAVLSACAQSSMAATAARPALSAARAQALPKAFLARACPSRAQRRARVVCTLRPDSHAVHDMHFLHVVYMPYTCCIPRGSAGGSAGQKNFSSDSERSLHGPRVRTHSTRKPLFFSRTAC